MFGLFFKIWSRTPRRINLSLDLEAKAKFRCLQSTPTSISQWRSSA
jgi:hypothetical protein